MGRKKWSWQGTKMFSWKKYQKSHKCILIPWYVLDTEEQYEIEKRKNNIVIRGMQENKIKNDLPLAENITKIL